MYNKINNIGMLKTILFCACISLIVGLGFAGHLYVSPTEGNLGKNCVEGFNINMSASGSLVLGVDIEIDTSMEYVDFVPNKDLFNYYFPPKITNGIVVLGAFSMPGKEVTLDNASIGTLYLKNTSNNIDSYIKFLYEGDGITTDSNFVIVGGIDVLKEVSDGMYLIDGDTCIHSGAIDGGFADMTYDEQMAEFNKGLTKDANIEKVKNIIFNKFVLGGLVIILIVMSFVVIKSKGRNLK